MARPDQSALRTGKTLIALPETIERERYELRRHADTGVAHDHKEKRLRSSGRDGNPAAMGCEADVRQQVPEHLAKPFGVGVHGRGFFRHVAVQLDPLQLRRGSNRLHGGVEDARQRGGQDGQLQLAGHDARRRAHLR